MMEEPFTEKSCAQFLAALSSKAPVPGGGGAAALVGALGTALCSMAGNLTLGRKKYADAEPDILRLLERSAALQTRFLQLVEEDAKAFEPLSRAYGVPKTDPERERILEQALLEASGPPMEIMRACCQAIELLEEMLAKGSAMLVSDVGCGAVCCRGALDCAALNVMVNTRLMKDRGRAEHLDAQAAEMRAEYGGRAAAVAGAAAARLRP